MTWHLWWLGFWEMLPYFVLLFAIPVIALGVICYQHDMRIAHDHRKATECRLKDLSLDRRFGVDTPNSATAACRETTNRRDHRP
jgi:hypothetical protein